MAATARDPNPPAPARGPDPADPERHRRRALAGSPAERYAFAQDIAVNVDGYRQGVAFIEGLIARAGFARHPGGLWLLGDGGVGKTFIMDAIVRNHPPTESEGHRHCPVLMITLEHRPNVTDILVDLLLQMGQHPAQLKYDNLSSLKARVKEAVPAAAARAVLFDEAQHLWLRGEASRKATGAIGGTLGDFLKRLYDDTGLAFVFSGTSVMDPLRAADTQASSRWSGYLRLNPFGYDDAFVGLLGSLDTALPMAEPAGLASEALARPLHDATGGNFRVLKNLLAQAVFLAASARQSRLTRRHLADAYFQVFCQERTPFDDPPAHGAPP